MKEPLTAPLPVVMTVAGSDSGGGAGIQADLKTFAVQGCFGVSVLTALTAQNSRGVTAVHPVPPPFIRAQLDAVLGDMKPCFAKTGMLPTAEIVGTVADKLARAGLGGLVVDPVMISTTGHRLIDEAAAAALVDVLFPLATLITPNIHEASALLGAEIGSVDEMQEAARRLHALGPRAVLVKGGHLSGTATDCYFDGSSTFLLEDKMIDTAHTHGSGCVLSAVVTAFLAKGLGLEESVRQGKPFITAAIRGAFPVGQGPGPVNPLAGGAP